MKKSSFIRANDSSINVTIDTSALDKIFKKLEERTVRVGVLGDVRTEEGDSVASYAVAHEFGSPKNNIPRRSFLFEPLSKHLKTAISQKKAVLSRQIATGKTEDALETIGLIGVGVVKKAFETSNDGTWAPLAQSTINKMREERRRDYKILIDEGTLMGSITSEVVKK